MSLRANLNIAGVNLAISCQHPIAFASPDPAYQPFLSDAPAASCDLTIAIALQIGGEPGGAARTTVFDTGESWVMSGDDAHYYLTPNPRRFSAREFWAARISRDIRHVTVYCGERLASSGERGAAVANPVSYPLDQILLMLLLAQHEGALVHAAGVNLRGRGLIFPGKSGAGKSTLATHLAGREGIRLLSDDRIALRKDGGRFLAYGTPWPGEQGAALNESAPLSGVYFLCHADADEIVPLRPQEAAERLMPVTSIPWYDPEPMTRILQVLDVLVARVPAFEFRFKPGPEAMALLESQAG